MSLLPPASTKSGSDERVKGVGRGKSNQKIAGTPATEPVGDSPGGDEPSLPKLLSALALGARAANGLPPLQNRSEQSSSDDDEFSYLMAFPEFSSRVHEGRAELAVLLSDVLRSVHISSHTIDGDEVRNSTYEDDYGFDSPVLWEKAAEACESLLEDVDVYVQSAKDGSSAVAAASALENAAAKAMTKSRDGYAMLMAGLVDMKKPQITFGFESTINNSRTKPFVPAVHPDKPHAIIPLSETLKARPGHGLETRNGDFSVKIPNDVVAPNIHYPHQYEHEIRTLTYKDWQLAVESEDKLGRHGVGGTLNRDVGIPSFKGLWIDTEEDLGRLVRRINNPVEGVRDIAVDLEAHSHRSFSGITCLMQMSLRRKDAIDSGAENSVETASDFLVDTLALRKVLNRHLASIFANPGIVKVMHGADSDIPWLQRDFGIYVVNLFDTGRAARIIPHFKSAGLAYLLSKYAGIVADKKHQLSDWRQRPLPDDMHSYATSDTAYLLDIYDRIKLELHSSPDVSVVKVLDQSKKVCLLRYDKEPFRPSGFQAIVKPKRTKRKRSTELKPQQTNVLKALYDWRDKTARNLDESTNHVCPNSALLRIATICPKSVSKLQNLVNPCPALVKRCSDELIRLINHALSHKKSPPTKPVLSSPERISELRASASPFAFFRPAEAGASSEPTNANTGDRELPPRPPSERSKAGGMMSPVVGTEALFKQAGWMTPQGEIEGQGAMEAETTDDSSTDQKQPQLLSVNAANENYTSNKYSSHSLEMDGEPKEGDHRGQTVDGLGAAREALSHGVGGETAVERDALAAQKSANKIQGDLLSGNHGLLNLGRSDRFLDQPKTSSAAPKRPDDIALDSIDNDPLPRSMKEIYSISNRNRRGSKAVAPVQRDAPEVRMDVDTIEGAEALLCQSGSSGGPYFAVVTENGNKKQKQESQAGGTLTASKQEDISLMTKIGWLKSKEEAALLMAEKNSTGDEVDAADTKKMKGEERRQASSDGKSSPKKGEKAIASKPKKRGGKRGGRGGGDGGSVQAFDYSKVASIGVYGPKGPAAGPNPFFSGAALSSGGGGGGGSTQQATDRKRGGGGNRNKNKPGGGERIGRRDAGSKTHIYRK